MAAGDLDEEKGSGRGELQYEKKQSSAASGLHAPLKVLGSSRAYGVCARACMQGAGVWSHVGRVAGVEIPVGWKRVALVGGVGLLVVMVLATAFSGGDGDRATYPDPSLSPGRRAAPRGACNCARPDTRAGTTTVDGGSGLRRVRSRCECGCVHCQEQTPVRP